MFHSDLLVCRWISFSPPPPPSSPPPATFRATLLRPETIDFEADIHASGNPVGKQQRMRRHAPPSSGSLLSTRRRVSACGSFSGDGTPHIGSFGVVLLLYPSGGPPLALLIHLFAHFASVALCQSSSPRFGSSFSSSPVPQP